MAVELSFVLRLSGSELRARLEQRGWPEGDAAMLVECSRSGCPECTATICETLG